MGKVYPLRHNDLVTPTRPKAQSAISLMFLLGGLISGTWMVYIPSVKADLGLGASQLGLLLLATGVGSVLAMLPSGRLIDRFSSRPVVIGSGLGMAVAALGIALADHYVVLMVMLAAFGFCMGNLDVSANANAVVIEQRFRVHLLSSVHALWSAGNLLAALVGSALLAAGATRALAMGAMAGFALLLFLIVTPWVMPGSQVGKAHDVDGAADGSRTDPAATVLPYVLMLGVLSAFLYLAEGAAGEWSGVLLREHFGARPDVAALGFAVFSLAMTAGRFAADGVVRWMGPGRMVRWGSAVSAVGLALAILAPSTWLSIAAWGLVGIGAAGVLPQLFRAASVSGSAERAGRNLSIVVGMGYAGMLTGPALIGFLADVTTLPIALLCIVPTLALTALAAGRIRFDR